MIGLDIVNVAKGRQWASSERVFSQEEVVTDRHVWRDRYADSGELDFLEVCWCVFEGLIELFEV